jgi:hypothetical protein
VILALSFSVQFLQLRFTCCRVFLLVLGLVLFRRTGLAGSSFVGLILSEIFWGEKKGKSSTRRPLRRFITFFFFLFELPISSSSFEFARISGAIDLFLLLCVKIQLQFDQQKKNSTSVPNWMPYCEFSDLQRG